MTTQRRYVAKAEAGVGWRIWDRRGRHGWGNFFTEYPDDLLAELNGDKRPPRIVALSRRSYQRGRKRRR
jgi:hypothetical protein